MAKALPMLGKAIPVLSIAVDIGSIVSTWTNNNETLQQASKLKSNIAENAKAFSQAVKSFQSSLEEQVGNAALRDSLKKLLRLRKSPPKPPMGPETACKILDQMQQMKNIPLKMFITYEPSQSQEGTDKALPLAEANVLPGDGHEQEEQSGPSYDGSYTVEILQKEHVLQLSHKPMCAPVVDSIYEQYPKSPDSDDEPQDPQPQQPLQSAAYGGASIAFQNDSEWWTSEIKTFTTSTALAPTIVPVRGSNSGKILGKIWAKGAASYQGARSR